MGHPRRMRQSISGARAALAVAPQLQAAGNCGAIIAIPKQDVKQNPLADRFH